MKSHTIRLIVLLLSAFLLGCLQDANGSSSGSLKEPETDVSVTPQPDVSVTPKPDFPSNTALPSTEALNYQRTILGIPNATPSPILTQAAKDHANYLALNGIEAKEGLYLHREDPTKPGFTGATIQERLNRLEYQGKSLGENVAFRPTTESAIQSWLESLYSRIPLIQAGAIEVGTGIAGTGAERVIVMVIGRSANAPTAAQNMTFFPGEDAEAVARAWEGNELPQPAPPPAGYPSGPIISLHLHSDTIESVQGSLTQVDSGVSVSCTLLTFAEDMALSPHDAALIPYEPLEPSTRYRVSFNVVTENEEITQEWQFTTQPSECHPVKQDCGLGRACYVQQGLGKCQWVGEASLGAPCAFMNECTRGSGCYGIDDEFACRKYCDRDGPVSCDTLCPLTHSEISDSAFGFCW